MHDLSPPIQLAALQCACFAQRTIYLNRNDSSCRDAAMNSGRDFLFTLSAIVAALMSAGYAMAQAPVGLDRSAAQITRVEEGRPLSNASKAAPADVATGCLRNRGRSEMVLASLRTTRSSAGAHGVTHVRIKQVVDGLTIHGAYLKAVVNSRGELVQVIDRLVPVSAPAPSRTDALAALRAAMVRLHPTEAANFIRSAQEPNTTCFDGGAFSHGAPTVTAVAIPTSGGNLHDSLTEDRDVLAIRHHRWASLSPAATIGRSGPLRLGEPATSV